MLAEHQRDAVARAAEVIDRCGGVLLADEPGLGKSFIAAELARCEELRAATVEVIVPASLAGQWNETLRRFGVSARIETHDAIVSDTTRSRGGRPAHECCSSRRRRSATRPAISARSSS